MSALPPDRPTTWSAATRDRSFLAVFIDTLVGVFVVFGPFLDALLIASAVVVVSWPLYARIRRWSGDRAYLASGITTGIVVLLVLIPVLLLASWCIQEAAALIDAALAITSSPEAREQLEQWVWTLQVPGVDRLPDLIGADVDLGRVVLEPIQRSLLAVGQTMVRSVPNVLGSVLGTVLDGFVFLFAVVTLYAEGPTLLRAAGRLSPLRAEYHARLFEVFREFSTNLVLGALTTAAVQASIAGIGFAIAGVPNLVLLGLMTAVVSFVPLIGTAIVWAPVAGWVWFHDGLGWGLFLVGWNVGLTGTVDNVLRPLLLRGRSPIHPLPIVLSVLGGLYWLGLPGALVGPVLVAAFVAMYRIWTEQLIEQGVVLTDGVTPPPAPRAQSTESVL